MVVAPVQVGGGERWCVLQGEGVTASAIESLDATRRLAEVCVTGVEVPASLQLPGLTRDRVRAVLAALTAAECAGGAAWCVDTAASHASTRQQFGRPIGQFQGVKHRCADMLVALEQARSVAWDAAAAWSTPSRAVSSDSGNRSHSSFSRSNAFAVSPAPSYP